MDDLKTKDYTRKAINAYRKKHDFLQLRLPLGTLKRLEIAARQQNKSKNELLSAIILKWLENNEKPVAVSRETPRQERQKTVSELEISEMLKNCDSDAEKIKLLEALRQKKTKEITEMGTNVFKD